MSVDFEAALERVSRVHGVRGAMLVDAQAGVAVVAELAEGVSGQAVAALAASLAKRTRQAAEAAEFGALRTIQLEGDEGHLLIAASAEIIAVAVTDPEAQLGLVRLEIQKAVESL